jgi:Tautomerase enzyme
MPYVNIAITREGATPAQKASLIKGITDLLVEVLVDQDERGRRVRNRGLGHRRAPGRAVPAPAAMRFATRS